MFPPSSGSKNEPSKEADCLPPAFTLALFIDPEDAGTFSCEILVDFQRTTRRYIPENRTHQSQISPSQGYKAEIHLISLYDLETSPLKLWLNPKAVLDVVWMAFPRWNKFFSEWFRFSLPVIILPTLYIQ
jgi:hypothetical protein